MTTKILRRAAPFKGAARISNLSHRFAVGAAITAVALGSGLFSTGFLWTSPEASQPRVTTSSMIEGRGADILTTISAITRGGGEQQAEAEAAAPVNEAPAAPVASATRLGAPSAGDREEERLQFIRTVAPLAQESQQKTGVPASVTIAQAILESDWGRSGLSQKARNYFGIKAHGQPGTAGVISMRTGEVFNGQAVTITDAFRAYLDVVDSFIDHGRFFIENRRYARAFNFQHDSREFARQIHAAGYATDPDYSPKLIRLMDRYSLYQFDLKN